MPDKHAIYGVHSFAFDSGSTLTSVDWEPRIVNQLFNAEDMSAAEYAQTFMEGYKSKGMVSTPDGHGGTRWEYTGTDGLKVEMENDKRTKILAVPKAAERKFD